MAHRLRRDGERIAETPIELARQAKPLADTDRQRTAMHEHRRAVARRRPEHLPHGLIVQTDVMHRRKEANHPQAMLTQGRLQPGCGVGHQRIEHKRGDEAIGMKGACVGDRLFVARDAGNQDGLCDRPSIQFGGPPGGKRFIPGGPTAAQRAETAASVCLAGGEAVLARGGRGRARGRILKKRNDSTRRGRSLLGLLATCGTQLRVRETEPPLDKQK